MNRWQQRQQQTRLDFLQATLTLILEHGYEGITVVDIAERANYGRSTFYHYFKDKDEVVWAVFEHYMGTLDQHIIASVQHFSSPMREYESWKIIFRSIDQWRGFFTQFEGLESLGLRKIAKDFLIQQFEGHLRAGRFSLMTDVSPDLTARFFVSTIFDLVNYWLLHPELGGGDYMAGQLFQLIFRASAPTELPNPPMQPDP
jgi:AcrR family transcriptional regulator